jgi:hypothetical protein
MPLQRRIPHNSSKVAAFKGFSVKMVELLLITVNSTWRKPAEANERVKNGPPHESAQ